MVTIIPSYLYSIVASLIVGAIIVSCCAIAMTNLRNSAVTQQLTNVDQYVATQSLILINDVTRNEQNASQILDLPAAIGNREYWISLTKDSSVACIESGFGSVAIQSQPRIYIPANVATSGTYVSGWGTAVLECCFQNQTVTLTLTRSD
jgi:hypothetical protein